MATRKSDLATTLDELQAKIRPALKERGFRARGRAFNRTTSDGLTEVVRLQMGSFDPPGTAYIPGLRENLYGKFTVNKPCSTRGSRNSGVTSAGNEPRERS